MTCIFSPKSGQNRHFFDRAFGVRDRLLSVLGGGRAQKKHFGVPAFGEVSRKRQTIIVPRWVDICVTGSGVSHAI